MADESPLYLAAVREGLRLAKEGLSPQQCESFATPKLRSLCRTAYEYERNGSSISDAFVDHSAANVLIKYFCLEETVRQQGLSELPGSDR
jgi:hypothetical protein